MWKSRYSQEDNLIGHPDQREEYKATEKVKNGVTAVHRK